MQPRLALASVTLIMATNVVGCYSTWDIAPRALRRLDGFRAGDKTSIGIVDGEDLQFTSESKLYFLGKDGREAEMRFHAINVNYPLFSGQEAGTQRVLYVDLSRVAQAKVQNLSPAKTTLVTCGIVLAGANAALGLVILALFSGAQ